MSVVFMPYLESIARLIGDAFPSSRVDVWAEDSIFDRGIIIKAVVDNDGAYTTIFPGSTYTEAQIAELLIAQLKERKTDVPDTNVGERRADDDQC